MLQQTQQMRKRRCALPQANAIAPQTIELGFLSLQSHEMCLHMTSSFAENVFDAIGCILELHVALVPAALENLCTEKNDGFYKHEQIYKNLRRDKQTRFIFLHIIQNRYTKIVFELFLLLSKT